MASYKSIFVYLWIACSAYPLDESQRCPEEFVQLDNSCYYFSTDMKKAKNLVGAQKSCKDRNSHLVSIETTEELLAIDNYSIDNNLETAWYFTSGLNLQNQNEFIWTGVQKPAIVKWCKGFPTSPSTRHCILLGIRQSSYRQCLHNSYCENPWNYICESKLNAVTNKSDINPVTNNSVINPVTNKSVISSGYKTINIYNQIFFK